MLREAHVRPGRGALGVLAGVHETRPEVVAAQAAPAAATLGAPALLQNLEESREAGGGGGAPRRWCAAVPKATVPSHTPSPLGARIRVMPPLLGHSLIWAAGG